MFDFFSVIDYWSSHLEIAILEENKKYSNNVKWKIIMSAIMWQYFSIEEISWKLKDYLGVSPVICLNKTTLKYNKNFVLDLSIECPVWHTNWVILESSSFKKIPYQVWTGLH